MKDVWPLESIPHGNPRGRVIKVRYQHEVLEGSAMADQQDPDDDDFNILLKARELRHGQWIERILVLSRRSMTGTGVDNYKDLSEKQLASLPNLTGPGSHPTWEAAILKITGSIRDGRQLCRVSCACTH